MNKATPLSQVKNTLTLDLEGMTCAACAARIERVISKNESIDSVSVNFPLKKAVIKYQQNINIDELIQKISSIGYSADISTPKEEVKVSYKNTFLIPFISLVLSAGVVVSIIGTFLPWIEISENQYRSNLIGWDQGGSAWIVLIIGTLAAGVTGPVWNGSRSLLVNVLFIFFGTVLLIVASIEMSEVSSYQPVAEVEKSVGVGLPTVLAGGMLMIWPSVLDKQNWKFRHKI